MTWPGLWVIGETAAKRLPASTAQIVLWAMILILIVLVGGVVILLAKQRSQRKEDTTPRVVYSLHELRLMLKRGEISQAEFEKLKEIVSVQTRKTGRIKQQETEES